MCPAASIAELPRLFPHPPLYLPIHLRSNRPQFPLAHRISASLHAWQVQNRLLNVRRQVQ